MSNAAESYTCYYAIFFRFIHGSHIEAMMSAVDLPFLNADCMGPINFSAASCILLRMMRDKIFLNTETMQIGLRFSVFCVVWEWV